MHLWKTATSLSKQQRILGKLLDAFAASKRRACLWSETARVALPIYFILLLLVLLFSKGNPSAGCGRSKWLPRSGPLSCRTRPNWSRLPPPTGESSPNSFDSPNLIGVGRVLRPRRPKILYCLDVSIAHCSGFSQPVWTNEQHGGIWSLKWALSRSGRGRGELHIPAHWNQILRHLISPPPRCLPNPGY